MPEQDQQAPLTMDEETITLHEILESFIRAGFSRKEAFELVKSQWAVNAYIRAGLPFQSGKA
jgi:hypothetical protein